MDSRAKAKIYAALRHNTSLDDRNKKIIKSERKENTPLHLMSVTQRNIPHHRLSVSPALLSGHQTLREEVRVPTTVVKKKRACLIPECSISNEITAKLD
jgi:ADP-dependent phosphofructokinase/glucokinase